MVHDMAQYKTFHNAKVMWRNGYQWRIQDLPEVGASAPKVDVKGYYLANFCLKLHKIERTWTPVGTRHHGSSFAGADPEFPVGGGADPPGGDRQHMILPNFPA